MPIHYPFDSDNLLAFFVPPRVAIRPWQPTTGHRYSFPGGFQNGGNYSSVHFIEVSIAYVYLCGSQKAPEQIPVGQVVVVLAGGSRSLLLCWEDEADCDGQVVGRQRIRTYFPLRTTGCVGSHEGQVDSRRPLIRAVRYAGERSIVQHDEVTVVYLGGEWGRWGLVIPLPAAVPDVEVSSDQASAFASQLSQPVETGAWLGGVAVHNHEIQLPLNTNPHPAGIPVGRTCDVRFVAKEDVVSDVYAGHDLVPRRNRADDWRVVIPFQSGKATRGAGQGLQTHDFKLMSWHMLYKLIKVGVDGTTIRRCRPAPRF